MLLEQILVKNERERGGGGEGEMASKRAGEKRKAVGKQQKRPKRNKQKQKTKAIKQDQRNEERK